MNLEKLLQIIKKAGKEEWKKLDLSNQDLEFLPTEIGKLTKIKNLFLDDNQLTGLPPEIKELTELTVLNLSNNQLIEFPPELGALKKLRWLDLGNNQLTELPSQLGKLTQLAVLYLYDNQLMELPPELGELTQLVDISLFGNQLNKLPQTIEKLINLQVLSLGSNQFTEFPPLLLKLSNLRELDLYENQITVLPSELGMLPNLTKLILFGNRLKELPPELGKLPKLVEIDVDGNPLMSPPREIVKQGKEAVLAYLRGQLEAMRRQWMSKVLVVGEGGVGKTSLLRSLKRKEFKEGFETTHGVQIETIKLNHPEERNVIMTLNSWDFGGQTIYHATHQFFLTDHSLFILTWNARHGYEQGKLYYWLDTIQARAPGSPVLIVATWIDERDPDLPLTELRRKYPQIAGHYKISNKTGEGIDELRDVIARISASLPLMGKKWPANWLSAAEAIRVRKEKHITPQVLWGIMKTQRVVNEADQKILATWMHELGDILFFQEDEGLDDIVILKPQWVTSYISKVLESEDVIGKLGIFTRDHMQQLWEDLDFGMQDHFLRLMEKFDLSYRTLEDKDISLVVERLPLDPPPDYKNKWDVAQESSPSREISMKFKLNTLPAGIPTWFIARSHRFTTRTHWRLGALFADIPERRHLALVQAFPHERCLQLTVRGPLPQNFFALLKDGIELTLRRFPGLRIDRMIPCPGHNGNTCNWEFNYNSLQKAIERTPPVVEVQCQTSFEMVPVAELLFGLHWFPPEPDIRHLLLEELRELRKLIQRGFTNEFQEKQASIDSHCPNVFVLRPINTSKWAKPLKGQKIELQLYCQAPGSWHPTREGGRYLIDEPAQWITSISPYLQKLVKVLKYAVPLTGPLLGATFPGYEEELKKDLKLMEALVKILADLKKDHETHRSMEIREIPEPERVGGAALRVIRQLLEKKDPYQYWGGLEKILTPEGHYLWLCPLHASEYRR